MNRIAERAHIESEEVAAVSVLSTGESDTRARKTRMDDLRVLMSVMMSKKHYVKVKIKKEKQTVDVGVKDCPN